MIVLNVNLLSRSFLDCPLYCNKQLPLQYYDFRPAEMSHKRPYVFKFLPLPTSAAIKNKVKLEIVDLHSKCYRSQNLLIIVLKFHT